MALARWKAALRRLTMSTSKAVDVMLSISGTGRRADGLTDWRQRQVCMWLFVWSFGLDKRISG